MHGKHSLPVAVRFKKLNHLTFFITPQIAPINSTAIVSVSSLLLKMQSEFSLGFCFAFRSQMLSHLKVFSSLEDPVTTS